MMADDGKKDILSKIQISGSLLKLPFGQQPSGNRWQKRFFVIKDGYLLYYPDNEKKDMEKRSNISLHPKGIVPLGGCSIQPEEEPTHPFCIRISHTESSSEFLLAAENEHERDRWIKMLDLSSRITWRNAQLGDAMIQQLEKQGLQLAKEKQEVSDRLKTETIESESLKHRAEELEQVNIELEREKLKMEKLALETRRDYDKLKREQDWTSETMKEVEETKQILKDSADQLQRTLQALEAEKQSILDELHEQVKASSQLSNEKESLCHATDVLSNKLQAIEVEMHGLHKNKSTAEISLKEQEAKARQLELDKELIAEQVEELAHCLQELSHQKATTESELKEEIIARREAERRLQEAEESLARIENKLVQHQMTEGQETALSQESHTEIMLDVKTLKKFFENLAFEAKLDAEKCIMIKRCLQVRHTNKGRARTVYFKSDNNIGVPETRCKTPLSSRARVARTMNFSDPALLPTTPLSPTSTDQLYFENSARMALSSPSVRSSVIGFINQIDSQTY